MATLRTLVTRIVLEADKAFKGLKAYDALWKATARSVEASANVVERASQRAMDALLRVNGAAASAGATARGMGSGGGGGTRGGRPSRTSNPEVDRIVREGQRQAARQAQQSARQQGLAAGSVRVDDAARGLGALATASDRAKAKVADLTAQVARNRKEMADLREQAARTGDADGTLAARMQGLAVATGKASVALQGARRDLREVDGGLIDTIKRTAGLAGKFDVLKIAAGNLVSGVVSRGLHGVADGITGAAKAAIDFESSMADVRKVLNEQDLANFGPLTQGVKDVAREIGVLPNEVAALTASLAQSGIAGDELLATAGDASKLAVAFGISGEEAGQALAKLRTGLGLSRDEVNGLAGTINELSNNLSATAPEITDAVQRVGSVASAANISAQSTAALATAMIASGANAEVAATGTKNFIRALGSGAAATKRQREAFAALGLSAEETAGYLVKGGAEAEATIADVVRRIGQLRQEDRLPVLIELFGSESIGAIGPLATNLDLLTKSFNIAGDAAAAAGSVEREFAARSSTTDQAIKKLRASVEVLAIDLGNQLLPYINDVVKFLTSPEGQEWGKGAVESAASAVVSLAEGVKGLVQFFGYLTDKIGGAGVAIAALAPIILSLTGPLGAVAIAAVAMGAAIGTAVDRVVNGAERAQLQLLKLHNQAQGIRAKEQEAERAQQVAEADEGLADTQRRDRVERAVRLWEEKERTRTNVSRTGSAEDLAITRKAARMRDTLLTGRGAGRIGTFEERVGSFEASLRPAQRNTEGGVVGLAEARAEAKAAKDRARRKGRGHQQTKMDQQLAVLDPSLRHVLVRGGDLDEGGDLKVHDDVLSRGAFGAAAASRGLGSVGGGSGGVGPGPNIQTTNVFNNITVHQAIDARGQDRTAAENVAAAADWSARMVGNVTFTGIERIVAARNSGGRMVGA